MSSITIPRSPERGLGLARTIGPGFTIGKVSRRTGVHIETIRYYEKIGLLPKPPRSGGGHRLYDGAHVKRLTFIRRGRELGFTLDQIRTLLALVDGGDFTCDEVKAITLDHRADVRRKVADLRRIDRVLKAMADQCRRGRVPDCPIVDALFESGDHVGP